VCADRAPSAISQARAFFDTVSSSYSERELMGLELSVEAVAATLAVAVSIYSYVRSVRLTQSLNHVDSLRRQYDEFNELSALRIEYPEVSHVLELPELYESVRLRVAAQMRSQEPSQRSATELRERAVALRVFELYEQTLYHRKIAAECGNKNDVDFFDEVLSYMTERLLRNPRLAYFWCHDSGEGLATYFEPHTRDHYDLHVRPHAQHIDPIGAAISDQPNQPGG
jgi:hypothetical protein